jgi:hypothetical protein
MLEVIRAAALGGEAGTAETPGRLGAKPKTPARGLGPRATPKSNSVFA